MDVQGLLRDRRVWLAGGVVAVGLGAVTFLRRRKEGGASSTGGYSAAGTIASPAGVDTTGTDVASWLGQYSGALDRQLTEYGRTLTESLAALGRTTQPPGTPGPSNPGTGGTGGGTVPAPTGLPRTNAAGQYSVGGLNAYDFVNRIKATIDPRFTWDRLVQLNPTLYSHIIWSGSTSPKTPTFTTNTFVNVR